MLNYLHFDLNVQPIGATRIEIDVFRLRLMTVMEMLGDVYAIRLIMLTLLMAAVYKVRLSARIALHTTKNILFILLYTYYIKINGLEMKSCSNVL